MYINFVNDRKYLGYKCLIDSQCGNRLVLITDSSVVYVKSIASNGKRKILGIIVVIVIIFSDVKPAEAVGPSLPPQQDEKLIKSIISKADEADWYIPSINKILKRLGEVTLEIGTNDKLLRILAELEKPISESPIFVEGWMPQLPRHRKLNGVEKNKYSSLSIDSLLDSTKCYGHREGFNMPRSVSEKFETKSVKKLANKSLKDPRVKREYKSVKNQLEDGIHPVNLSERSTFVSSTKVLVKKNEARYIVDVSDTYAYILGLGSRTNQGCIERSGKLMNELYDLNLRGY